MIDERYTLLLIGDFNDLEQLCIIHDEETDELSYKILPADETIDPKKVLAK